MAAFNGEEEQTDMWTQLGKNKDQLILLNPHEEAKGIDHDFESPTFIDKIGNHIRGYLEKTDRVE